MNETYIRCTWDADLAAEYYQKECPALDSRVEVDLWGNESQLPSLCGCVAGAAAQASSPESAEQNRKRVRVQFFDSEKDAARSGIEEESTSREE